MKQGQSHDQERYSLMEKIQMVDFALVDLTLYLDTHPEDTQAVQQFNQLAVESRDLKTVFEQKYGPLRQYGGSFSGYPWNWSDAPWPWQL
ncbi:spore coat protein CotJB [Halobacillus kuroshimensis]|uniref:Spore coat protein CotJB n=1 Tax=Halobacillus kuroshimensis TaxID=302481 RepID=A0ABS3DTS3_9BACI|nr:MULTISPECIES: spore coat protein CotJB [Halobacillus]MBN8234712.1 spore coat protein CotJB [Halobacillus kuroshimensis]